MALYESPRGLYDFQAEGVAKAYLQDSTLAMWDTGTGKSHLLMCLIALLFEDDEIDQAIVVCEKNKLGEWMEDFAEYTKLSTALYHGKKLATRQDLVLDPPQVLVSTYETVRNDAAKKRPGSKRALDSEFFTSGFMGKRIIVGYDEMTKLKSRSSALYKHHDHMLTQWRKRSKIRVVGLTATPIERDPENAFNMGRLLLPGIMTVDRFEIEHVASKDLWGNFDKFKNIGDEDHYDLNVVTLKDKLAPLIQVKRKTDPDVRDFFPRQVEEYRYVNQEPQEADFYEAVEEALDEYIAKTKGDDDASGDLSAYTVLRQIACHPASILHSQGDMARLVVDTVGPEGLLAIPCAKLKHTLSYLEPLVKGQGAQAVLFTFFGQSVLPLIHQALVENGYRVVINHGGMTQAQREMSRHAFSNREADIFLTSDAGSRGINLKTAEYVVNYELPLTHANYIQRINRIHRIDSEHPSVTCQSFVTFKTVEEGIVKLNQSRNEWTDYLFGDDDDGSTRLTAEDRRLLRRIARDSAKANANPGRPWERQAA